jgi:hypothetical protein
MKSSSPKLAITALIPVWLKLASKLMGNKLKDGNQEVANLKVEIEKSSEDLFDRTMDFIWSIDLKAIT